MNYTRKYVTNIDDPIVHSRLLLTPALKKSNGRSDNCE